MARRKQSTFQRLTSNRLNRSQRRALGQRLASADPGLTIVHPNAGGIDVGNESHFAAVPPDRDPLPVQEFGCWTADLIRMANWLRSCRIDTVAVQATGVYWIALYDILTKHGIRVVLVNALYTKNVPGRKSDVQECQWLMKLHTYGLLRDSFHLDQKLEGVRTVWRVRSRHVQEAARAVQHMQKALTKMNIQLANALSDISGVSGQAIIGAILQGERDPYQLADLRDPGVRASREEVARSLEGNWREDVLFELQQAVDSYHFAHRQMQACDAKLAGYLASLPTRVVGDLPAVAMPPAETPSKGKRGKQGKKDKQKKKGGKDSPAPKATKPKGNAPAFDLEAELTRICGVDLTSIDGISVMTAQTIVAEVGTDLSAFATEDDFASWLGLTPSKDISGGKVIRKGKRKVQNRVAGALRMAATSLLYSDSYLGGRYRYLRRQLATKASATKAMAHYLALLVYRLLTKGQAWVDRGVARYEAKRKALDLAGLQARARAQGYQLVPVSVAP